MAIRQFYTINYVDRRIDAGRPVTVKNFSIVWVNSRDGVGA
jgi:hypothetical protein